MGRKHNVLPGLILQNSTTLIIKIPAPSVRYYMIWLWYDMICVPVSSSECEHNVQEYTGQSSPSLPALPELDRHHQLARVSIMATGQLHLNSSTVSGPRRLINNLLFQTRDQRSSSQWLENQSWPEWPNTSTLSPSPGGPMWPRLPMEVS